MDVKKDDKEFDVLRSALTLSRTLKRRPPMHREHSFPPAIERALLVIAEAESTSFSQLCVDLDIRPSSLSELTDKMSEAGLIEKKDDANDKRVTLISLTEAGKAAADQEAACRKADLAAFSACFTEEEAEEFCELADKLSSHLKAITADEGSPEEGSPCGPEHRGHGGPGHCHRGHHGPRRHHCF